MVALIGPVLLPGLSGATSIFGVAVTTAAGSLTFAGQVLQLGLTLAASAALAPKAPTPPPPQQQQQNFRADIGSRTVHIGRAKIGGQEVLFRQASGKLYILIVQGHGVATEREVHFLDGREVFLSADQSPPFLTPAAVSDGYVTNDQYLYGGQSRVRIQSRLGIVPETYYSEIEAAFPDWDNTHRLDGLSSVLITLEAPPIQDFNAMFPNRTVSYSCVAQWLPVYDNRTNVTQWTENPALYIRNYITSAEGLNSLEIDDTLFDKAANDCDTPVVTSTGADVLYRIGGSYRLTDATRDVLRSLLNTCDGELYITPEGKWGLSVGVEETPEVTIESKHVISVEWSNGPSSLETYSTLKPAYTDQSLGYVLTTIDPWYDADLEARYGRNDVRDDFDLTLVPVHAQARRLAKRRMAKDNPIATAVIKTNLHGLKAYGERYVNIDLGLEAFGIDYVGKVRVDGVTLSGGSIEQGDTAAGVTLQVSVIDPEIDTFTIAEEGTAPVAVADDVYSDVPIFDNFIATPEGVAGSQATVTAGIIAGWASTTNISLTPVIEYSTTGDDDWQIITLAPDASTVSISGLVDGQGYDVRGAWVTPGGSVGEYSTSTNVVATASQVAPNPPTNFTAIHSGPGEATIELTVGDSDNHWKTEIYRGAALIFTSFSSQSSTVTMTDSPGAGNFTYTARSLSVSGLSSTTANTTPSPTFVGGGGP